MSSATAFSKTLNINKDIRDLLWMTSVTRRSLWVEGKHMRWSQGETYATHSLRLRALEALRTLAELRWNREHGDHDRDSYERTWARCMLGQRLDLAFRIKGHAHLQPSMEYRKTTDSTTWMGVSSTAMSLFNCRTPRLSDKPSALTYKEHERARVGHVC